MAYIAVLGHGVVGSGVLEVLTTHAESIRKRAKEAIEVKYILDLKEFPGLPYSDRFVKDFNVILNDPEVRIVVEVMGGLSPAYDFVKACFENGKSVVTSNKELVAHAENTVVMVDEAGAVRLVDAVLHGDAQVLQIAREERGRHQRRARKVVDRVLAGVGRRQHAAGLFGFQLKGRDHNGKADLFGNRHAHAVHAPPLHRRSDEAA